MSHYATLEVKFTDAACLAEALEKLGYKPTVHEKPVALLDYDGRPVEQLAHVIVSRKQVGHLCNDVGFLVGDAPVAHICNFAKRRGFNEEFLKKLKQEYAVAVTTKHYTSRCQTVRRVNEGKKVFIYVNG